MASSAFCQRTCHVAAMFTALAMLSLPGRPAEAWAAAPATAQEPIVILNVADLHMTDAGSMEEFKQVIALANAAIKPTFTYIAGDTPDGGTLDQYQIYKQVMDTLHDPVYNVAGDHEAKGGGLEYYRKLLGEPTYSFDLGRYHVIALSSMEIDEKQLSWARKDLDAAKTKHLTSLLFIHHNFAGIRDAAAQDGLNALVKETGVKLVLAGHTHTNTVINDGAGLQITTTSIKAPRGKDPKGYALITLDEGRIAWHFIPLGQQPVIAICSPISKLMTTGPEGVVRGKINLRVKAFDTAGIKSVTAIIDGGSPIPLAKGQGNLWIAVWDSALAKDGEHVLKVAAQSADGKVAAEEITIVVNQAGTYTPSPATVSDAKPGGPKGPKGPKGPGPGKGERPADLGPPRSVGGVVESFNFSPKGDYEGLLLAADGKPVQVNFPPHAAAELAKAIAVGDKIAAMAVAEEAKGDHPVFTAQSITDANGKNVDFSGPQHGEPGKPKPKPENGLKPKPNEAGRIAAVDKIVGKIKRLNYARHGEVNGAVLESGDFVHLGPKASAELKLAVGQGLTVEGPAAPIAFGGRVIEHPTKVNGAPVESPGAKPGAKKPAPKEPK